MRTLTPYEQTQLARYGTARTRAAALTSTAPIEYLTGIAEFCGLQFHVDERVLIPRLETEELVDLALQSIAGLRSSDPQRPLTIGDIGTGAGAIAITLAQHLIHDASLTFYATEVSRDALAVAQENARTLLTPVQQKKVLFVESNLLADIPDTVQFDLLISNLPYIPSERIRVLDESVKDHEPHIALDGGPEGLSLIATFVKQARSCLRPEGVILLELDYTHTEADFAPFSEGYSVSVFTDSFTRNRFARLTHIG